MQKILEGVGYDICKHRDAKITLGTVNPEKYCNLNIHGGTINDGWLALTGEGAKKLRDALLEIYPLPKKNDILIMDIIVWEFE